jgi:hypothetical protein
MLRFHNEWRSRYRSGSTFQSGPIGKLVGPLPFSTQGRFRVRFVLPNLVLTGVAIASLGNRILPEIAPQEAQTILAIYPRLVFCRAGVPHT